MSESPWVLAAIEVIADADSVRKLLIDKFDNVAVSTEVRDHVRLQQEINRLQTEESPDTSNLSASPCDLRVDGPSLLKGNSRRNWNRCEPCKP